MRPYTITSFKYGLDARREPLLTAKGALVEAKDAIINSGGEIEKRLAFVETVDLNVFDNSTYSVTSISRTGSVATVTCPNHGLAVGDWFKIAGATGGSAAYYNGAHQVVSVTDVNTFTFTSQQYLASGSASGTLTLADLGLLGLEVTEAGLLVFGSALIYGTTPTLSQPVLETAIPSGVTYQQLQHPSVESGRALYDRGEHRLTKIVHSINYQGKAFVCAQFADGRRFLYYDGELIKHSSNGLVMAGLTTIDEIALSLKTQIEAIGWRADANVNESNTAENGSVIVKSPTNDYFEATAAETSTEGQIGIKFISKDVAAVDAVLASAKFQMTGYTGTWQLAILNDSDASVIVADLTGGPITGATSVAVTLAAIAQAVNDFSYVHRYTAQATATDLAIYAPVDGDVVSPSLRLRVTYTTGTVVAAGTPPATLIARIETDLSKATMPAQPGQILTDIARAVVSCIPTGGTPPYTYAWTAAPGRASIQIEDGSPSAALNATVTLYLHSVNAPPVTPAIVSDTGTYRCVVTDSLLATAEAFVSVNLRLNINVG